MNDSLYELEQLTEEEVKGFEIYRRKHMALYPPPAKPNPTQRGWQFWAYLVVSVAAVLLASMRTAEQFYRAATFSANPVLGFVEAFLAVFTVETGIVVYAAVIAVRQKKISQWVMWVGIVLLAGISIVAGLGQSLYLISDVDPATLKFTEYMLSILIGPGASIAALIGGHILGQQIAQAGQEMEQQNAEYELEIDQYNDKVIRAWQRSTERKMVLGMMPMGKLPYHEMELEPRFESHPEPQNAPEIVPAARPQTATSLDGGNHRPVQVPPQVEFPAPRPIVQAPLATPVRTAAARAVPNPADLASMPMAVPAGANQATTFDSKYTRMVTQWLISKGKTPFDGDINLSAIAQDTHIDQDTVRNILLRMRHARNG